MFYSVSYCFFRLSVEPPGILQLKHFIFLSVRDIQKEAAATKTELHGRSSHCSTASENLISGDQFT